MKYPLLIGFFFLSITGFSQEAKVENVILVTFDGYRWQELFGGAQKKFINAKRFVDDIETLKAKYWDEDAKKRRKMLMPFFWETIARQGQIYGNKRLGNKVSVTNGYKFSYPGYNEIFSGFGDKRINSNEYPDNPNTNIFDFLYEQEGFAGNMAAFATWDAFPRIINTNRNHTPVFVNMKADDEGGISIGSVSIDKWSISVPPHQPMVTTDTFTYTFAKEYLQRYHPRFAFIGFDETDEFGHAGRYDAYLNTAHTLDRYMQDLWEFIQNDPQYKDKTALIITCDHGRGNTPKAFWKHHGKIVVRSKYVWIAAMGPGIAPKGEIKESMDLYQNQIAATIAALLGFSYKTDHYSGKPIKLMVGE